MRKIKQVLKMDTGSEIFFENLGNSLGSDSQRFSKKTPEPSLLTWDVICQNYRLLNGLSRAIGCAALACAQQDQLSGIQYGDDPVTVKIAFRTCGRILIAVDANDMDIIAVDPAVAV